MILFKKKPLCTEYFLLIKTINKKYTYYIFINDVNSSMRLRRIHKIGIILHQNPMDILHSLSHYDGMLMFYSQNLKDLRLFYCNAWNKKLNQQDLSDLEKKIVQVIEMHPEYQKYISENHLETEFTSENPFLHFGLHLAIKEQIQTNRPQGIQGIYLKLIQKKADAHQVEHCLMEILQFFLWDAQSKNQMPDEKAYLQACEDLSKF